MCRDVAPRGSGWPASAPPTLAPSVASWTGCAPGSRTATRNSSSISWSRRCQGTKRARTPARRPCARARRCGASRCRRAPSRRSRAVRILHLTSFVQGGAGQALTELALGQRRTGHAVSVVTSDTPAGGWRQRAGAARPARARRRRRPSRRLAGGPPDRPECRRRAVRARPSRHRVGLRRAAHPRHRAERDRHRRQPQGDQPRADPADHPRVARRPRPWRRRAPTISK